MFCDHRLVVTIPIKTITMFNQSCFKFFSYPINVNSAIVMLDRQKENLKLD